jgi:tetratricopeptide (TPR) repeat protein
MPWDAKFLNFAFVRSSVGQLLSREVGALRVDPPDRKAFKALFAQLYLRQPDGSLSTALMPVEEIRSRWRGYIPFDRMLEGAVSHRILQVNTLQIGGQDERLYVSLGHDALAKIADSWDEELRRGARLRRMAMWTAAAFSLAVIMAVLSLVAFTQSKIAMAARTEALGNLSVAQNAADQMLTEVGEIDLADIPQMEEVRRRLLEGSSGSFRDLAKPSALGGRETSEIKLSRARAETSLADLLRLQGDDKTAIEHYNTARVLLDPLYNQDPSQPGVRRSLARVCDGLGNLLKTNPRYGDAYNDSERYFRRALDLRSPAASQEEKRSLADTWYNLGTLHARKGERKKAHEEYQAAIEQLESVSTREKDDARRFEDEQRLVRYWINLGINLTARPDLGDAAKVLDRAVREAESLYANSPGRPGSRLLLSRAKNNLAATFLRRKPADARALLEPAEGLLESLTRDFPKVVAYHQELSSVVRNLAICNPPEKRTPRLEKLLENLEALGHKYPEIPEFRRLHARNETALALYLLTDRHDPKGALAGLDRARQTLTSLVEQYPDDPAYRRELGKTYSVLAAVSSSAKDYAKSIAELDEAIKCHQEVAQTDPDNESLKQELCNDFIDLAKVLDFRGDVEQALAILNDAVDAGFITQSGQLEPSSFPHLKDREEFRKLRDRLPAAASPKAPAR